MEEDSFVIRALMDPKGFLKGSETLKSAIKSMGNMAKTFQRTIRQAVKSIIGIGAAYQIVSKAVSAYMQQNEKLSQSMNAVWTAFGNLVGPIIEKVISLVTSAVSYLLSFLKLLGVTTKSASQLSKSAKSAGGSVQKTVAGFDELNKLQDSGGGGGGGTTLKDVEPTEFMKKIEELISEKKWKELGQELGRKASEFITSIPKKISSLIKKVDWKEVGAAISGVIRGFFEGLTVEDFLDALVTLAHDIWNAFLDLLWGIMAGDSDEEPPIVASLRKFGNAVEKLWKTLKDVYENTIKPIFDGINALIEPILTWLIDEALPWLIDRITEVVNFIAENESVVVGILTAIGVTLLPMIITGLISLATMIFGPVIGAVTSLFAIIAANPLVAVIALIAGIVAALVHAYKTNDKFREAVDRGWSAIKEMVGSFFSFFKEKIAAFKSGLNEAREKISAFKDKVRESFDNIKEKAQAMWDKIKEIFSFKWQLPHIKLPHLEVTWEPAGDLAKFFGINSVPSLGIRWYARGGIVNGAHLIGAGEDGKEAIIPLERNTEWINKVADGLLKRLEENQNRIGANISALQNIADTVAFRIPAVAAGSVTPYSVSTASGGGLYAGGDAEILRLLEALYELFERFVEGMDNMQFVAEFEDLRALAKKITKEQKRQTISEGW